MTRKRLGQHFLNDENYLKKIVDAAEISPDEACLEIGAGTGALTRHLLEKAKHVTAVEIDKRLVSVMRERVSGPLTVIEKDSLDLDLEELLRSAPGKWKVVANLPYQITSPVIFRLLEHLESFAGIFLVIQREVAERVAAGPGGKDYGTVSIHCQMRAECGVVFRVPPGVFSPPPKVESALLRMIPLEKPLHEVGDLEVFRSLVRGAFEHRRKTCYNSLLIAFNKGFCRDLLPRETEPGEFTKAALEESEILPEQRPETISLEQFARLSSVVTRAAGKGSAKKR